MKKFVLCVSALLALGVARASADELATRPAGFSPYNSGMVIQRLWTGFYLGINGGYAWPSSSVSYFTNDAAALAGTTGGNPRGQSIPSASESMYGPFGGGQIGYNLQLNAWVAGVEADYDWSHFSASGTSTFRLGNVGNSSLAINETMNSFGTVRARLGLTPVAPLLLYGTGGLAYGRIGENYNLTSTLTSPGSGTLSSGGYSYRCRAGTSTCFAGSETKTVAGWTLGFGGEYLVTNNITFRAEFLYVSLPTPVGTFGALTTVANTAPASFTARFSRDNFGLLRGGLNLKF